MFSKYSNELNKTDQHLANAVLSAYVNLKDNLSRKEISFIETHLSKCNDCKKRLNEIIEEDKNIDTSGLQVQKSKNKYYYWSAAALLIIAIGIGMFYIFPPREERIIVQDDIPEGDSLIIENDNNLSDDKTNVEEEKKFYDESDFAANIVLENFINRNVRSKSAVKIMTPVIGDTLNIPISFKWEAGIETGIEIVNNKNHPVVKNILSGGSFTYTEELKPGLYYWKILTDSKLEAVGKFYIK
ncbi:MAG: hypothetical protein EHM47_04965 [Ignavibacteriales bacterium]|nr:MAG: hypothetical protein EHM47_04965 [Ignavibacteriales bacterium]